MDLTDWLISKTNSFDELVQSLDVLICWNCDVVPSSDGTLCLLERRALFQQLSGLRIEIFSNDHPPPHFHVMSPDVDAVFDLHSGDFLRGKIPPRHRRLVEFWYPKAKSQLIQFWESRQPGQSIPKASRS